jgi:hypothetical protein
MAKSSLFAGLFCPARSMRRSSERRQQRADRAPRVVRQTAYPPKTMRSGWLAWTAFVCSPLPRFQPAGPRRTGIFAVGDLGSSPHLVTHRSTPFLDVRLTFAYTLAGLTSLPFSFRICTYATEIFFSDAEFSNGTRNIHSAFAATITARLTHIVSEIRASVDSRNTLMRSYRAVASRSGNIIEKRH